RTTLVHAARRSLIAFLLVLIMIPPPPFSTLFPYTTLFRSDWSDEGVTVSTDELTVRATEAIIAVPPNLYSRISYDPRVEVRRDRSEEHTSELQSRFDLVCRLLLEKKKNREQTVSMRTRRGT